MAGDVPDSRQDLAASSMTIPSDSENYSSGNNNDLSPSPPSSSASPMILYSPPTIWSLLRGAAINLLLPFVNGLMLGFGELFAHEAAFRLGWSGTKVQTRPLSPEEGCSWSSRLGALHYTCFCLSILPTFAISKSSADLGRVGIDISKRADFEADGARRRNAGGSCQEHTVRCRLG